MSSKLFYELQHKGKIMIRKLLVTSLLAGATLFASSTYVPNLNSELKRNTQLIKEYEKGIKELKARNEFLQEQKKKNPKLYVSKPFFEETKKAYIQRIKLNGAEAQNLKFKIQNHMITVQMNMKTTRDDKNGYFQSSESFYQEYAIPKDVQESKITNYKDGDYFTIKMPKK